MEHCLMLRIMNHSKSRVNINILEVHIAHKGQPQSEIVLWGCEQSAWEYQAERSPSPSCLHTPRFCPSSHQPPTNPLAWPSPTASPCILPCQLISWQSHAPLTLPAACSAYMPLTWPYGAWMTGGQAQGWTSGSIPCQEPWAPSPAPTQAVSMPALITFKEVCSRITFAFRKYCYHSYKSREGIVVLLEYFFLLLSVLLKMKYSSEIRSYFYNSPWCREGYWFCHRAWGHMKNDSWWSDIQ